MTPRKEGAAVKSPANGIIAQTTANIKHPFLVIKVNMINYVCSMWYVSLQIKMCMERNKITWVCYFHFLGCLLCFQMTSLLMYLSVYWTMKIETNIVEKYKSWTIKLKWKKILILKYTLFHCLTLIFSSYCFLFLTVQEYIRFQIHKVRHKERNKR